MLLQTGPAWWNPAGISLDPGNPAAVMESSVNYSLSSELSLTYHLWPSYWYDSRWESMMAMSDISQDDDLVERALNQSLLKEYYGRPSWAIGILLPTISPCQDPAGYKEYLDNHESMAMPPVNPNSCPQLDMPNTSSFPGFFAVTGVVCFLYSSLHKLNGSVVNGQASESLVPDPIPLRLDEPPNTGAGPQLPTYLREALDPCVIESVLYTSSNYSLAPKPHVFIRGEEIPARCAYGFEWRTAAEVLRSLVKVLIGDTDSSAVKSDCAMYSSYRAMMCTDAWWLSGIYNGGYASVVSIQAYMDRAFKSFNDQLRMMGTD